MTKIKFNKNNKFEKLLIDIDERIKLHMCEIYKILQKRLT